MVATLGEVPAPLLEWLAATARFAGLEHDPLEGEAAAARALELAGRLMRRAHEEHAARRRDVGAESGGSA